MEGEEAVLVKTKSVLFPENGKRSELKCLVVYGGYKDKSSRMVF